MTAEQEKVLKEFVRAIVRTRCWGLQLEEDGGTIQDLAEKHGIIIPFACEQSHLDSGFLDAEEIEVGDTAYKFSEWMEQAP